MQCVNIQLSCDHFAELKSSTWSWIVILLLEILKEQCAVYKAIQISVFTYVCNNKLCNGYAKIRIILLYMYSKNTWGHKSGLDREP